MRRPMPKEPKVKVEVGMGASMGVGTDCYAYEIVKVINPKHVIVRRLDSRLVSGDILSESQEYEFHSNVDNKTLHVVFRYGRWWGNSQYPAMKLDSKYERWSMGAAHEYRDPCF